MVQIIFRLRRLVLVLSAIALGTAAHAQVLPNATQALPQITQTISDSRLARLEHHTHAEANRANDRGAVANDLSLPHMQLQLQRSPAQEQALQQYIDQLQDSTSPNFHHWLTAADFGARFGLAPSDLQTIEAWLAQHGFRVNFVYPNGTVIDFSGTAGQVRAAFRTEIHHLSVGGTAHIANMSDPQIPAALSDAVVGVVGLNDFKPHRQYQPRPNYTVNNGITTSYLIAPADLATIYNLNPLFSINLSGQGQTIAVVEDTNVYSTADWSTFRSTLGLSGYAGGSFTQIHPQATGGSNCADPGVNADDGEAILDAEWASAAAPSAAIVLASCSNSTTGDGLLVAIQNLVNGTSPPPVISVSYGECEANITDNASYNAIFQQAVAEGISVFVAAGDWGAAVCDASFDSGVTAHAGIAVNGLASTPYNVAVGGTDFGDTYQNAQSTYWNSTNSGTFGSAKSYVPEVPWNNTCANTLIAAYFRFSTTYGTNGLCNSSTAQTNQWIDIVAGSGGPSTLYAKPSWQAGMIGIQSDGKRDLPDVSLFAGSGILGHYYVFCYSDPGTNRGGSPCTGAPSTWAGGGGTSFASPILAGMQALVNQQNGGAQGNPNPIYYALATAEYGTGGNSSCNSSNGNGVGSSCIFYDVTQGDNDVPCTGTINCYRPSGTIGVLSTSNSNYQKAYSTTTGWDFASGIGSVNAYNLVNNWQHLLTISIVGSGTVTSSPAGINCGTTCKASFDRGQQVTLTATPAPGWGITSWGSGVCFGAGTTCAFTITATTAITATFTRQFALSASVTGNGLIISNPTGIDCGDGEPTCSGNFNIGQSVALTAGSDGFSVFTGWGGACSSSGTSSNCFVTMNSAQSVTATFVTYRLTVNASGQGTVTSTPAGINCGGTCVTIFSLNQQVSLTATPAPGWSFFSWSGACTGNAACTVTMSGTETVSANFVYGSGGAGTGGTTNTWAYRCSENSFDNLNGAMAGTAPWMFTDSAAAIANGNIGQPSPGDVVEILSNPCLGDVTISINGLIVYGGFSGQVDVDGATGIQFINTGFGGPDSGFTLGTSNFTGQEFADLYIHNGATVTITNGGVNGAPMRGILVADHSTVVLLNATITRTGTHFDVPTTNGDAIAATDNSTVTLGNPDGTQTVTINGTSGFGVDLGTHSVANAYGSFIESTSLGPIYANQNSTVHLEGAHIAGDYFTGSGLPAVTIAGGSNAWVEPLGTTAPTIGGSPKGAIAALGGSSITLRGATISNVSSQQPTVEATANSAVLLAGGNTISNTQSGGVAVQIDHSSSLTQSAAGRPGYITAPDTITGDGLIQEQSSADIGVGLVSGNPSLSWTTSPNGIQVQQNSLIHLAGGVTVNGTIVLQQASNGFTSINNGGSNTVTQSVVCPFTTVPSAHLALPQQIAPSRAIASSFNTATSPLCLPF